jgi:hypothetical protein
MLKQHGHFIRRSETPVLFAMARLAQVAICQEYVLRLAKRHTVITRLITSAHPSVDTIS